MTVEIKLHYPRFSPINDKLIFNYFRPSIPCTIGVYGLAGGGLSVYQAPADEYWVASNFSSDGK